MTAAPPDSNLLADYVQTGSKAAFEQIVTQYIHLVHAAAMRQVRDAHLAEDITQAVFLLLWQRAASLQPHGSLAGWLLVATHHISANAIKKEWRLKKREQKVAQMKPEQDPSSTAQTDSILPQLDSAIAQLKTVDRDAIVERFFNSRSLEEVGATLGVSQQAAAKRISRAMDKLRDILARRGITTSQAMLSALLPAVAQQPAASQSLLSTVLTGHAGAAPTALARGAIRPWSLLLKPLAAAGFAVLGLGGITYLAVLLQGNPPPAQPPQPPVAAPQPAALPTPAPATPSQHTVTLSLIDAKTKTPLADGTVELDMSGNRAAPRPAGPDGKFVLQLPKNYQYARAICRVPGRASMSVEFQNYTFKGDLPDDCTIPMDKGATIGGIVTDDMGNPLSGAKVHVGNYLQGNPDAPTWWLDEDLLTDNEGKWHYDNAPAKLDQMYLEVTHHDYPQSQNANQIPVDQLHKGTYEIVMRQVEGSPINGVVLDPDGKPVKNAKIVVASDRYESNKPTTTTDADGKFVVKLLDRKWDTFVTVTARGFAPEQAPIPGTENHPDLDPKADAKPLEIHLKKPVTLAGSVIDQKGKPVKGATVEVESWRDNRALKWSTTTNSAGQFTWNEAPADTLQLNVRATRMAAISGAVVTPGGAPVVLTLYPPLKIAGNVIDADTKAPIQAFRIVHGIRWTGQDDVTWQPQDSRMLGNGKYEANITDFSNGGRLRVEADGYLPVISRMILASEGSISLDFELKKGTGPTGIVLDPDGKPVADVRVVCVTDGNTVYIDPDRDNLANRDDITTGQTDKDGHFALRPQEKKTTLLVVADAGFAAVKDDQLSKDGQIHLQKWARIEGDYRLNASPAKFVTVGAQAEIPTGPREMSSFNIQPVTTDANGHFVIDRVPPDQTVRVYELVSMGGGSQRWVQLGSLRPTAGQTTKISAGGKGRPVVAKLLLPPTITTSVDFNRQLSVNVASNRSFNSPFAQSHYPDDFPDMTEQQQTQWYQDQMKTRIETAPPSVVDPDVQFITLANGAMRANNVAPGTYRVYATLREAWQPGRPNVQDLGHAILSFTVPATPACPTDEPLDIGAIQLTSVQKLEVGKPLPHVDLVTTAGQPIDQSSWTGKVIVLHPWSLNARQFFPALEQIKSNSNIQIVNVGLQMLPAWINRINAKTPLPGLLAMDKDSMDTQAAFMDHAWMMQMLPGVLLLDVHGNLIAKISDPNQLAAAVDQAVGK